MSGPCPAPLRRPTSSCRPRSPWCRASSRSSATRGRSRTSSTTPAPRRSRSRVRRRSSDDTATRPVPCGENRRRHTETQHTTGSHGSGGLGATAAGVGSAGCGGGGGSQSRSAGRVGSAGGGGGWNRTVAVGGVLPGCVCVCVCRMHGCGREGGETVEFRFFFPPPGVSHGACHPTAQRPVSGVSLPPTTAVDMLRWRYQCRNFSPGGAFQKQDS